MIGIGITGFNRPHCMAYAVKMIEECGGFDKLHISNGMSISESKNDCLNHLKECDHIFLFDDDCFPIKQGWQDVFIEASKRTGQQHFMYMNGIGMTKAEDGVGYYEHCNGVLLYMTKKAIESVGAFSPKFKQYGFEHANYSDRIHEAGLTPKGKYSCPVEAGKYIYSLDLDSWNGEVHKQLNHKPSLTFSKSLQLIKEQAKIYESDKTLYYPL